MGKINYKKIYDKNHLGWKEMTEKPGRYEALLAGHYSDCNHFVYELLQNAEDERASSVVFEYYRDKIIFFHDGDPFDEADVSGVSSMLETTKLDEAQMIGKFGMGFKSVFKYTCEPQIYSDNEAFCIKNYLLPVELKTDWNYKEEIVSKSYNLETEKFCPFIESDHLTKVVLPFQKRNKENEIYSIDGRDIVEKLKKLEPEILLFLTSIKSMFWIDMTNGKYEKFTLKEEEDENFKICKLVGNASDQNSKRYGELYFLKYKKIISTAEMGNAEVSLAFETNLQKKSILRINNSNLWVYFPTKDRTMLPCLLHGSFETAVSREKLMSPSSFNNLLFRTATDLFVLAVKDFKRRNMISQMFIRQILFAAFNDKTLPNLKFEITNLFMKEAFIPVANNKLVCPKQACISVPYDLTALMQDSRLSETFKKDKDYVIFNDMKSAGFTEYYLWLIKDLKIESFTIYEWAKNVKTLFDKTTMQANYDAMEGMYQFLKAYSLENFAKEILTIKKSIYEENLRSSVKKAWEIFKTSKILINGENKYVAAYNENNEEQVFLSSTSEYYKISKSAVIMAALSLNYKTLLEESFEIKEFDNFQYVKEKVLGKYTKRPKEIIITESFSQEYANDIIQISRLISSSYEKEMKELIKDRCLVIAQTSDNRLQLRRPSEVYREKSIEGADLRSYYQDICPYITFLDEKYYREQGISIDYIMRLGVRDTPVNEGIQRNHEIRAIGEFYPYLKIEYLRQNIEYIKKHKDLNLAKEKSVAILKIALENASKMKGKIFIGESDLIRTSKGTVLQELQNDNWIYVDGSLQYIEDVSKNQLDKQIYKNIDFHNYGEACSILGFIEDETEKAFDSIVNLDKYSKQELLKCLATELGVNLIFENEDGEDTVFDPTEFDMQEFPKQDIVNLERLERYIQNQFYSSDPVQYREVIVRKRDSAYIQMRKSYVRNMYTNQFGKTICQSCKKIIRDKTMNAVEIANYGVEMEQLALCLCPECYQRYENLKKKRSDQFKESIKRAIQNVFTLKSGQEYKVDISEDMSLSFTQTHAVEIQKIFQLLDEYGIPAEHIECSEQTFSDGGLDEFTVHDGEMIEYQCLSEEKNKIHTLILDVDKRKLDQAMEGRPINGSFEFEGKKYRILRKL